MLHRGRHWTWLAGSWLVAVPVWAEPGTCAGALRVEASDELARSLLRELGRGGLSRTDAAPCRGARVKLAPGVGELHLQLDLGAQRAARQVSSAADAALWLESWLAPETAAATLDIPSRAGAFPAADAPLRAASSAERSSPGTARGRVGLSTRASLDSDTARWAGLEVSGSMDLGGPWWIGAGIGRSWDPVVGHSELGAGVRRHTTHAIVRAGGAWPLAGRSELELGTGLGVLAAFASGPALSGGSSVEDDEGVGVLELGSLVRVPFDRALELTVGLAFERTFDFEAPDAQEPDEPLRRAYPEWRSSFVLGALFRFGTE